MKKNTHTNCLEEKLLNCFYPWMIIQHFQPSCKNAVVYGDLTVCRSYANLIHHFLFNKAFYMLKSSTKRKFWNVQLSRLAELITNVHQKVNQCVSAVSSGGWKPHYFVCSFVCAVLLSRLIRAQEEARFQCLSQGQFDGICDTFGCILVFLCVRIWRQKRVRLGRNSIIFFVRFVERRRTRNCVQMRGSLVTEITAALRLLMFASSSKPFRNVLSARLAEGGRHLYKRHLL